MEDLACCVEFTKTKAKCKMKLWGGHRDVSSNVRCFLSRGDGDVLLLLMSLETLCHEMLLASL